ncbi:MAG: hypothetical protein D6791_17095 [Chloroflexi bacterium]|nr:MAG: hypothetical protein D6791_17095 [Chloroflexota bacterium]
MARALPSVTSQIGNLHRVTQSGKGRDVTRRYLRNQLRELDIQIETLTRMQRQRTWRMLERAAWVEPEAAEVVWTGRLELYYLWAVRHALVETLIRL